MTKFVDKIVSEVVKGVVNEMLKKTGLTGRSRATATRTKTTSTGGGLLGSIIDAALGKGTTKAKPKTTAAAKRKPATKAKAPTKSTSTRKPKA